MSQPTPYVVANNFKDDELAQVVGRDVQDSDALDAEFEAIEQTLSGTLNNLALIQRDDGLLRDQLIRAWNLHGDALALIGAAARWNPRGTWAVTTAYAQYDIVENGGGSYLALSAHTSSSDFAADRALGLWLSFSPVIGSAGSITTDAVAGTPYSLLAGTVQVALASLLASINSSHAAHALLAPLDSPAFTGIPTVPTPPAGANTNQAVPALWVQSELNSRSQWLRATGVDQTAQVLTAIANGGNVQLAPGNTASNIVLSQRIVVPSNINWTNAPGTILDFSTLAAPWENNFLNALIWGTGVRGTAYPIIAPVAAPRSIIPASASIAAGVATVNTVKPHGLVNNDRVHIGGQPFPESVVGSAGFFSQPFQAGADGDIPHVVTVVDTDTFTFLTSATAVPSTFNVTVPHNVITLSPTDAGNFQPGDIIEIDDGVEINADDAAHHGGELNRVKWVSGGDVILSYGLRTALNPANTPLVRKVTTLKDVTISGGEIRGRGYNPDPGPPTVYGQVGVRLGFGERCTIRNMRANKVDQTGFEMRSVINGEMSHLYVESDERDEGGRTTGVIKIQYGVVSGNANRNIRIEHCHFWGLRHSIAMGGGTAAYPGKSYNVVVDSCSSGGTWVSDVATHNTNGDLTIINCQFNGRAPALNVRSGKLFAYNNDFYGNEQALYWYYIVDEIDFRNNHCYNITGDAVIAAVPMTRWPRLRIEDNLFHGCVRAVRVDAGPAAGLRYVSIRRNTIRDCAREAIYLIGGTDGAANIAGVICDNDIENVQLQSAAPSHGIRVQNGTGVVFEGNKVAAGVAANMNRGIYIDGAFTTGTRFIDNKIAGSATFDFEAATGDYTIDGNAHATLNTDVALIAAGASTTLDISAPGATAGDQLLSLTHDIATDNLRMRLIRFFSDTIRVELTNVSGAGYDPPLANYRAVWRKKYPSKT